MNNRTTAKRTTKVYVVGKANQTAGRTFIPSEKRIFFLFFSLNFQND